MVKEGYKGLNVNYNIARRLHIELGTRCNLSCTGCARTKIINHGKDINGDWRLYPEWKIGDIGHETMKHLLAPGNNIKHLFFNANFSDPIYCGHLFETLDYINTLQNRPVLQFSTNASGRSPNWWREFASKFRKGDKIDFAIDGLQDTNHLYRINAKWNSIWNGVNAFLEEKKRLGFNLQVTWRFLVFKHNVHQIKEAKELSEKLGMRFKLIKAAPRTPNTQQPDQTWNEILNMVNS
jgi:MoaA/NifB/PqqE/SkfB family radical SAM enzyme